MIVSFLIIVLFLVWLLPIVVDQFNALREKLPKYLSLLNQQIGLDFTDIRQFIDKFTDPDEIIRELSTRMGQTVGILQRVIGVTTQTIITIALLPIYFFFFAWRFDLIKAKIDEFLPAKRKERIHHILKRMDQAAAGFFRGRIVVAATMIILYSVGWLFTGVPYWFLLGFLAGILNIAPYISIVIWPVAILLKYVESFARGAEISFLVVFVWPSVVYFAVQLFESWFLTPWIESGKTQMSIPTVLLAVFIGGARWRENRTTSWRKLSHLVASN
jgi:predicted PurR-regulated permease PerM